MGAWDSTAFGNDEAADWASDLVESANPLEFLRGTLALANSTDYLESGAGSVVVAAAAVVAAGCGATGIELPPFIVEWLPAQQEDFTRLSSAASAALLRVGGKQSELRELWLESDGYDEWNGHLHRIAEAVRL